MKLKRIRTNGIYAVLSYHFSNDDIVYVPWYMKNINGDHVKDGDIALVWRFPVVHRTCVLKLKVKTHNENVIKIPEKYIELIDGDVDGDCVCVIALSEDFDWKVEYNTNSSKITNTKIDLMLDNFKTSRCSSFLDVLLERDLDTWMKMYPDAVKRLELNETIPALPGTLYKRLINLHINKYNVKDDWIVYENDFITKYHKAFGDSDIWITAVQEITKVFYNTCLKLKHPNVNIDLDDMYSLYRLLTGESVDYFEDKFGIRQTRNICSYSYFVDKYFSDDFLKACFDIILDGVKRWTKASLASSQ